MHREFFATQKRNMEACDALEQAVLQRRMQKNRELDRGNATMAMEKTLAEKQKFQRDQEANTKEIENALNGDFLNERFEKTISAINRNRVIPYNFKGYEPGPAPGHSGRATSPETGFSGEWVGFRDLLPDSGD